MKSILVSFIALVILNYSASSQVNIAEARACPVGAMVTVSGVVTSGGELGTIRYIQDTTAGIGIYDSEITYFQCGDHVTVTGILAGYHQLLEVTGLTAHAVNLQGQLLPEPQLIRIEEMGESFEGELVRLNRVTFVNAGGNFSGNTNYNIQANGETGQVRINSASDLVGSLIPASEVDLTGILSQYSYNDPEKGYQLLLRTHDDILSGGTIELTSPVEVTGLSRTGFSLKWETNLAGTTQMQFGNTPGLELGVLNGPGGTGTSHLLSLDGAAPSSLYYVRPFSVHGPDTSFAAIRAVVTTSNSSGMIRVYFTSTVDHSVSTGIDAIQLDDLVDDTLVNYINRARYTIDMAIYNFGDGIADIAGAINAAYHRGVQVRIIVNGSTSNHGVESLDPAISLIYSPAGTNDGVMHNKFVVIDADSDDANDPVVWTGSANWTPNNINTDANAVIIIQDKSLAMAYTLEFNEMWGSQGPEPDMAHARFGFRKLDDTPHEFIIRDIPLFCYFSPSDGVNQRIIGAIRSAGKDIEVNTMLITRQDITDAIIDQASGGTSARVIVNSDDECTEIVVNALKSTLGPGFREYGEPGLLHSKNLIIDRSDAAEDPLVLTGSHNWSYSANDINDENTLVIHDAVIANLFYQEFMARFNAGVPLGIQTIEAHPGSVRIYPNPAREKVLIEFGGIIEDHVRVMLYNHLGQMVRESGHLLSGNDPVKLDLNNLASGIYILQVAGNGPIASEKLIIIH